MIGAGITGIAAAIRMAVGGYRVTVFERGSDPGGKMSEIKEQGYRFDKGPTVLTRPDLIEELFEISGSLPDEEWSYQKVDPIFNYFFEDGITISSHSDLDKFGQEVANKIGVDPSKLKAFLKSASRINELTEEVFLHRSLHQFKNYLNKETLRGVLNFGDVDVFRTMNEANSKAFSDSKLTDIFNRYASYNGSNPYLAPATLNVIAHYEINLGTYFSIGGMQSVVTALVSVAKKIGVHFSFNTQIECLLHNSRRITGLNTANASHDFDVYVNSTDVDFFYQNLLPEAIRPSRILNQPMSSSVIVFYWGIKGTHDKLGLHNMFLTEDSKAEYEHIRDGKLYRDPTIHLTVSSKYNTDDAPEGCENWAALISVPHDSGQDWDDLVNAARKSMLDKLSRLLGEDISAQIEFESVQTPRSLESDTVAWKGAVFGKSSNSKFSAFLRHPNFSKQFKNLFFCGGTVHPGAGVPLCLLSAKIATEMALETK